MIGYRVTPGQCNSSAIATALNGPYKPIHFDKYAELEEEALNLKVGSRIEVSNSLWGVGAALAAVNGFFAPFQVNKTGNSDELPPIASSASNC